MLAIENLRSGYGRIEALHGVSLNIGSVDPIDEAYLKELGALCERTHDSERERLVAESQLPADASHLVLARLGACVHGPPVHAHAVSRGQPLHQAVELCLGVRPRGARHAAEFLQVVGGNGPFPPGAHSPVPHCTVKPCPAGLPMLPRGNNS